jgi:hypothetical protein
MNDTLFADANSTEFSSAASTELSTEKPISSPCEQCGGSFTPRKGSGGKPQRFCSTDCRTAFNAQRRQRAPTCSDEAALPLVPVAPEPNIAPADTARFDWGSGNEDVLIHEQPATAIYWNPRGQVVIRQEAGWNDDSDPYLFFGPRNLPALIAKLQAEYDSWKSADDRAP